MEILKNNFIFLRKKSGLNQAQLSISLGFSKGVWNNYENAVSKPSLDDFIKITKYFGYSASDLIEKDLNNVEVIEKAGNKESGNFVEGNNEANVEARGKIKQFSNDFTISIVADEGAKYGADKAIIPITDLSVAAGAGYYNNSHIETVEALQLPPRLVKPGHTYLCVKIKGESMAPTLQDGGYVIIRLLDKVEWAKMPDERVFVVVDTDNKACLKRVKNRFKQGFIVLRSDSPDQATYPSFNLTTDEIISIWYVEWYFSAKMPNIHDQFYSRLQRLEDKVDDLLQDKPKGKPK